jgi:NtrC-family two-component system sensor histidine kinase KinB
VAEPAVEVAVNDQGRGVPAEYRERIFEKFFRVEHQQGAGPSPEGADRDRPSKVRGTGIGLYLCREIVRAHGGAVRCEAGDGGVGAKVVFVLPKVAAQPQRA